MVTEFAIRVTGENPTAVAAKKLNGGGFDGEVHAYRYFAFGPSNIYQKRF